MKGNDLEQSVVVERGMHDIPFSRNPVFHLKHATSTKNRWMTYLVFDLPLRTFEPESHAPLASHRSYHFVQK